MKIFPCFDWCIAHGGLWRRCFATCIGCWFHTLLIYFCFCFSGGLDVGRWSRGGSERGVFLAVEWFWRLRALGRAKQEVNGGSLFRGGERLWRMWTWRGFQDWALKLALGCAVCFIYWRPWGGQCHGDTGVKHLSWFMETLHWRERFWWMRDGTWDAFQIGFSSELRDCVSMVEARPWWGACRGETWRYRAGSLQAGCGEIRGVMKLTVRTRR